MLHSVLPYTAARLSCWRLRHKSVVRVSSGKFLSILNFASSCCHSTLGNGAAVTSIQERVPNQSKCEKLINKGCAGPHLPSPKYGKQPLPWGPSHRLSHFFPTSSCRKRCDVPAFHSNENCIFIPLKSITGWPILNNNTYLFMASSCFLFLSFFSCRNSLFLSFLAWSKFWATRPL